MIRTKVFPAWVVGLVLGAVVVVMLGCRSPGSPGAGGAGGGAVAKIASTEEFTSKVLQAPRPVMVDFYADWCGPCRRLAPTMETLAGRYTGRIDFVKVDVDKHGELAQRYNVRAIPLVVLIRGGTEVHRWEGAQPAAEYRRVLDTIQPAAR